MSCAKDPAANLAKAIATHRSGGQKRRADRLPARAVSLALFLPERGSGQFQTGGIDSWAEHRSCWARLPRRKKVVIVASLFERRTAGIYHNTAVVIDADGSIAGKYRKMHIPDDPLYYEKFYFTPGDLGLSQFSNALRQDRGAGLLGPMVSRRARGWRRCRGAQILFYPTAIGWIPNEPRAVAQNQRNAWELIQRSHAVANGVYVASANRVGREGKIRFWGNSFVAGPLGEIVAHAGDKREEILIAKCDLGKIEETRQAWPFLRDRRIDAYGALLTRSLDR